LVAGRDKKVWLGEVSARIDGSGAFAVLPVLHPGRRREFQVKETVVSMEEMLGMILTMPPTSPLLMDGAGSNDADGGCSYGSFIHMDLVQLQARYNLSLSPIVRAVYLHMQMGVTRSALHFSCSI
jgi:hypothetical protein